MWENYWAYIIQQFYKRFIKCERSNEHLTKIKQNILFQTKSGTIKRKNKVQLVASPVDPLYRIPYNEKNKLRIVEWHYNVKKPCVWHFNIFSLIEWLNTCKSWINPMTNCEFLNKSRDIIFNYVTKHSIKKLKLAATYNVFEPGYKKKIVIKKILPEKTSGNPYMELLIKSIDSKNNVDCKNLLHNNYDKIENDHLNLNESINRFITVNYEIVSPIGVLHMAIMNEDIENVLNLIYYGCNIEKECGINNYRPIHLAAIINNIEIGKILKFHGAQLDASCWYEGSQCTVFDICEMNENYEFINEILSI